MKDSASEKMLLLSEVAAVTGLTREVAFSQMVKGAFGVPRKVGHFWQLPTQRVNEYLSRRARQVATK